MAGDARGVVIVGAGMGGLACAIDLASSGVQVRVIESASEPGGKARAVSVGGELVDAGPTVLTMPWVFDELFDAAGASLRNDVALEPAEVLARHFWPDGARVDLFREPSQTADAIGDAFGGKAARAYLAFSKDSRRMFDLADAPFIRGQRMTLPAIVKRFGFGGMTALPKLGTHRSMWRALEKRFEDPHLRQLFGRYATYVGSSPYDAPATLNLIAHVESEGVYRVGGGIRSFVTAMEALAKSLGVEFRYDEPVERIVVGRGQTVGVRAAGSHVPAAAVVFNGDVSALSGDLLSPAFPGAATPTAREKRSLSAVTWAMRAQVEGFPLVHHNVFFSSDGRDEFNALFGRGAAPDDPTVYICAQDRQDSDAPRGHERLLVLVNAPPNGDDPRRWAARERDRCTTTMEKALGNMGLSLSVQAVQQTTPADFHRRFPATGGALYGPRSKGPLSMLARNGARTRLPGLYLAGGSVHPGAGMPMAALSGRLAAARIREDLGSTVRSKTAAISGSTSMA